MTLAEAIRKGCVGTEQCRGKLYRRHKGQIQVCALGAACRGIGINPSRKGALGRLEKILPVLGAIVAEETPGLVQYVSLRTAVMRLNDYHNMTREQIADWVASIEEGQP